MFSEATLLPSKQGEYTRGTRSGGAWLGVRVLRKPRATPGALSVRRGFRKPPAGHTAGALRRGKPWVRLLAKARNPAFLGIKLPGEAIRNGA